MRAKHLALLAAGTVAIVSIAFGLPGKMLEKAHPSQPNIEVVKGSFGSVDEARRVYQKESTTNVIVAGPTPAAASAAR